MTTSLIERSGSLAFGGMLLVLASTFLLPLLIPARPLFFTVLALAGLLLTLLEGKGVYLCRSVAALVIGYSLLSLIYFEAAAKPGVPDLEEPIPVPGGYGFALDPDSTTMMHRYASAPLDPGDAVAAPRDILDYYRDEMPAQWNVYQEDDGGVSFREGDSTRGISVRVHVVSPQGMPAVLDLRIQALYCRDASLCVTAADSDSEDQVAGFSEQVGPFEEPIPVPAELDFVAVPGRSTEQFHEYESTSRLSIKEGRRAQVAVMAYYERELTPAWSIVEIGPADLVLKDPNSTRGMMVNAYMTVGAAGPVITLRIGALVCPEEYWCTSALLNG